MRKKPREMGVDRIYRKCSEESAIPRWYFLGSPRGVGCVLPTREELIEMQMMCPTKIVRGGVVGPVFYMTEEQATAFIDTPRQYPPPKPTIRVGYTMRTEDDNPLHPDVKSHKRTAA